MCSSWKLIHVRADLSEQDLDGSSAESGDLIKPINRFLQRAQVLGNFAIQSLDSLLLVGNQIQEFFEHEAVMLVETALQRLSEQRLFASQASPCQLGQLLGILLPRNQSLKDGMTCYSHHIGHDRTQFEIGVLQHFSAGD